MLIDGHVSVGAQAGGGASAGAWAGADAGEEVRRGSIGLEETWQNGLSVGREPSVTNVGGIVVVRRVRHLIHSESARRVANKVVKAEPVGSKEGGEALDVRLHLCKRGVGQRKS